MDSVLVVPAASADSVLVVPAAAEDSLDSAFRRVYSESEDYQDSVESFFPEVSPQSLPVFVQAELRWALAIRKDSTLPVSRVDCQAGNAAVVAVVPLLFGDCVLDRRDCDDR